MSKCNHVKCQTRVQTAQLKISFSENIEEINEWPLTTGQISYRLNRYTDDIKKKVTSGQGSYSCTKDMAAKN
ncbi:hypothetical protein K0U27_08755 [archaeon]|nr:hypothetical protein [archaeon]